MTYKDFEMTVYKLFNDLEVNHIYIPYGKGQVDLAEAEITVKNSKVHASWVDRSKDETWGLEADFFESCGQLKVRWYDTYSFKLKVS